jgi:tetratricopeptide (TPR) repeat protein
LKILPYLLPALLASQVTGPAHSFYEQGSKSFLARDFARAKDAYTKAIAADPNYADAYRALGMTSTELKDFNGAYRAWLKAVDLNPKDERSKYFLGRLFYEADFPNEGAAWLREALQLSPDDFEATTYLGLCAEALSLDPTAGELYRKAIALSKTQNKPYSWAYVSYGKYLKKHGDDKSAIAILEEGVRLCPEAHELAALGDLLATHGDDKRAEGLLRQAIALNPGLSQAHYRLGLLLKSMGRLDESKAEMTKFQETKAQEDKEARIIGLRK